MVVQYRLKPRSPTPKPSFSRQLRTASRPSLSLPELAASVGSAVLPDKLLVGRHVVG